MYGFSNFKGLCTQNRKPDAHTDTEKYNWVVSNCNIWREQLRRRTCGGTHPKTFDAVPAAIKYRFCFEWVVAASMQVVVCCFEANVIIKAVMYLRRSNFLSLAHRKSIDCNCREGKPACANMNTKTSRSMRVCVDTYIYNDKPSRNNCNNRLPNHSNDNIPCSSSALRNSIHKH